MRIPSEPVYTIELDDEDDSEYNVPHWSNGVKCDETTCSGCGKQIGPYTTTRPGRISMYGDPVMEPVIEWIPVYQYDDGKQRPFLCQACVELHWFAKHENLRLVAEHLNDLQQVLDMLEKPWKYVDEWWTAFGIEQDEFFQTEQVPT